MSTPDPDEVTLNTLHEDVRTGFADLKGEVRDLRGEMRSGFADLKATLVAGFRGLPSRESSDEMVRLLREANRLHEERFTQLDVRIREQHLEIQQILRAVVEGQRMLTEEVRRLSEGVRDLTADIKALIARLDALIKGRRDGETPR